MSDDEKWRAATARLIAGDQAYVTTPEHPEPRPLVLTERGWDVAE